jgi:hypothetical protein
MVDQLMEQSVVGPARFEGLQRAFTLDVREKDHESIAEQKAEQKPGVYVRRERYTGEMMRIIELPIAAHAKLEQIPAQVKESLRGR